MSDQLMSEEGYDKLQKELDLLIKRRKEIAERIQTAKDMGDLSENAEYSEAKDALAFNEGRIAELNELLKNVTVVKNGSSNEVSLGSTVEVKVDSKENRLYQIVSFNQVDPAAGKISNESPLGQKLLGKKKGDVFRFTTPKGELEYTIINIS